MLVYELSRFIRKLDNERHSRKGKTNARVKLARVEVVLPLLSCDVRNAFNFCLYLQKLDQYYILQKMKWVNILATIYFNVCYLIGAEKCLYAICTQNAWCSQNVYNWISMCCLLLGRIVLLHLMHGSLCLLSWLRAFLVLLKCWLAILGQKVLKTMQHRNRVFKVIFFYLDCSDSNMTAE